MNDFIKCYSHRCATSYSDLDPTVDTFEVRGVEEFQIEHKMLQNADSALTETGAPIDLNENTNETKEEDNKKNELGWMKVFMKRQ